MSKKNQGGLVFSTNAEVMQGLHTSQDEIATLCPDEQHLFVRKDAKARKGKVVTIVGGFEGTDDDLMALSKRLKTACGVGGSAKEGEVIIQGELVERVHKLLVDWGYTKTKKR